MSQNSYIIDASTFCDASPLVCPSGPVLISLNPGTRIANPYPETPAEKGLVKPLSSLRLQRSSAEGATTRTDVDFREEVEP